MVDGGQLIAAAEEERFTRIKHWAGFPERSIRYCLQEAGVALADVDHIAVNRNPSANLLKKALYAFGRRPSLQAIRDRLENASRIRDIRSRLAESFGVDRESIRAELHNVEHHRAHLASAFFVSPFSSAAVLSVDGFGDFCSAMWGMGEDRAISVLDQVNFPHSLGLFYLALTQYLGFPHYGDEYKVMGLAPYGTPTEMETMRKIVLLQDEGQFELNLDCFVHHSEGVTMEWEAGEPAIGRVWSPVLEEMLGPPRAPDNPIDARHKNIAASMQAMYEEAFFHIVNHLHQETGSSTLCLAGGCAYNSVANGMLFDRSPFRDLYIQAAAGDAGGAIGAAFSVWNENLGRPRSFEMAHAYWGPSYTDQQILEVVQRSIAPDQTIERVENEEDLCRRTAGAIAGGKVVGWFQGRMEWGPRALGNRSIVCDPRRADMKEILNQKIKRRESFRPFAPSILREAVAEWFETDYEVPFMLQVYMIREEKRPLIPAVTHVNGTGRLQSVTLEQNPRYYRLIEAFREITGVPIVLNTSFNENEPVVNTPAEAFDCFARTRMDFLVLGDVIVERK
ncbi:MAG TPA: carbamoyltransferase C-terminal domain-containing protein [Thermoanaerobaculia bacterium]|nr:carbamoyltransferase C-terminal domain-containing protein [Thermoanaerobaculia bacterium]